MKNKTEIKIGFIGAGNWGVNKHLPALKYISSHDEYKIKIVFQYLVEQKDDHRNKIQAEWGFVNAGSSIESMLNDTEIDAFVVVINPARLSDVLPTLTATGKPVFCEKPPGASYTEALRYAQDIKQINLVAVNRRFMPLVQELKKRLNGVEIDFFQANMFRHNRLDSFKARSNPMATPFFKVTGIHMLDMLRYLVGDFNLDNIVSLEKRPGVNDGRIANASCMNGLRGQLAFVPTCGRNEEMIEVHSPEYNYKLIIHLEHNEESCLKIYYMGDCIETLYDDKDQSSLWHHGYIGEHLEFLQAIVNNRPSLANFQNVVQSLRLAEQLELG